MNTQQFVAQAEQVMPQYLDDLQTIVNIDSGTYTKAGVDRVGDYLSERFAAFGFATHVERQATIRQSPCRHSYRQCAQWCAYSADWTY